MKPPSRLPLMPVATTGSVVSGATTALSAISNTSNGAAFATMRSSRLVWAAASALGEDAT